MITLYDPKIAIIIVTLFAGAILLAILWMFVPESEKKLSELRRCKSFQRLKDAKECLEEYITRRGKQLVYRSTVEAMDEAILLIDGNDFPISKEKLGKTVENLYQKADFLEQNSEMGEREAFDLMAKIMRENATAMKKVFIGELVSEDGGAKK